MATPLPWLSLSWPWFYPDLLHKVFPNYFSALTATGRRHIASKSAMLCEADLSCTSLLLLLLRNTKPFQPLRGWT
ncbi:uncharacterized protein TRIVIDRAFT_185753 [Trichoderma virens Gv29-8]|uniref:Uncharacterized protein n=1 Tax=Hypocrea virens (strain Gv29-8 / FGSC 10586) TaxID=413071 RepID=G9MI67_HYPVG|nr:uncharacterized protein TRIVIDRAFT_185753 [Trichoderma virens Gv29-8]EHK25184.1 hypothetical protein TRIVIDRAFT_185753 [Trichoderma virens Gv29-8]